MLAQELFTERLYLRKVTVKDAHALFNIWSDPEVTRFMNISHFTDESQAEEMIHYLNQLSEEKKAIRYSIIETSTGEVIGSCGFNFLDEENEKTEIGYDIARRYWGKGYAPEAITALLQYAYQKLHYHRVEAKVEPENRNSIKVLQKLNFTFEGTLRGYEKSKGKFVDINMYSKLSID